MVLLLCYWTLTTSLQSRYCHPSFANEETWALRGKNDVSKIKHVVCNSAGLQLQISHKKLVSKSFQWHKTTEEREGNANIWERYSPWSSQHIPLYRKGALGSAFPETPVWILQAESTGELYRDGFFSCNPFSPPQATLPLKHFPLSWCSPTSDLSAAAQGISPLLGTVNSPGLWHGWQFPPIPTSDISQAGQREAERFTAKRRRDYWDDSHHGAVVSFTELLFSISSRWLLFKILKSISKHLTLLRSVSCQEPLSGL